MANGIAGIDHVIVGVRDLEGARMGWTRLGFTLTPRGRHLGQGTANYCIMFARDYLELLGFVTRDDYGHRLEAFLARREGAMSVAFAPQGTAEEAAAALAALGLHHSAPRALGRQLELPEGSVVPRFTLLSLPPEETPGLDCFLCGHLSPELMRRPEWSPPPYCRPTTGSLACMRSPPPMRSPRSAPGRTASCSRPRTISRRCIRGS